MYSASGLITVGDNWYALVVSRRIRFCNCLLISSYSSATQHPIYTNKSHSNIGVNWSNPNNEIYRVLISTFSRGSMDAPLVAAYSNLHVFSLAVWNRTEPEFSDTPPQRYMTMESSYRAGLFLFGSKMRSCTSLIPSISTNSWCF